MSASYFSPSWYRVADLKPLLRNHVRVHRQRFRDQSWYVLQDVVSGKMYRFSPNAYLAISMMDGRLSVHDIWQRVSQQLVEDAPSQDDMIQLLTQLHMGDVLKTDVPPDLVELTHRSSKERRAKWKKYLANPLALRIPLWDPDQFLNVTYPYVKWLFSWQGLLLWLLVLIPALFIAAANMGSLTENLSDRMLSSNNLFALLVVFPLLKFLHELGHAYTTKAGGGEVHEMGVMFLVFMPVPYVDSSAATAFRSKRHRVTVGAAGMLVELFLAALALYVWNTVEPGVIRALAFNVIFVAGVSTILFNANPLLRFDGYFMLSDWLEIPNLGQRANQQLAYLIQKYVFNKYDAKLVANSTLEGFWLVLYSISSFFYRLFISFVIVVFLVGELFFIGVLIALWSVFTMLVLPAFKGLKFIFTSPQLYRQRKRAVNITLATFIALLLFICLIPLPYCRDAMGVVWVPEHAELRARTSGFAQKPLLPSGQVLQQDAVVMLFSDRQLQTQLQTQQARVEQLQVEYNSALLNDPVQRSLAEQELKKEQASLQRLQQRIDDLVLTARSSGTLELPNANDLQGRYIKQGELLGYILQPPLRTVRLVVGQDDIDLVRSQLQYIELKLADRLAENYTVQLIREVPGGQHSLPSKALSLDNGGLFAIDPGEPSGTKTLQRVFQFDLQLPESAGTVNLGTRAYVRLQMQPEPLVYRLYRAFRQLMLSYFNV